MDDNRTEDFYGSSIRTPHDRYGSLTATEKHLSQANGDVHSKLHFSRNQVSQVPYKFNFKLTQILTYFPIIF